MSAVASLTAPEDFRRAMERAGLEPPPVIEPDKLYRFPGVGKRNGNTAGWCKLFSDGLGGVFGDWAEGFSESWQAKRDKPFTEAERKAFRERCECEHRERQAERDRQHAEVSRQASAILDAATGDPSGHPYALKKRVNLGPLVRRGAWPQRKWKDALLIPLYSADGKICTLQAINSDGDKDYLKGGRKRGTFHPFGKVRGARRVLIGEGMANVAVGVDATGSPSVAAMDAEGLKHVALIVRELAPDADLIFLADNDIKSDGSNPGVKAAMEAARSVGGRAAVPELNGRKCDWWDVWNECGADTVRSAIANAQLPVQQDNSKPHNLLAGCAEGRINYRRASDIQARPIHWLWQGRFARGKVSLLVGHPGLGKSQVTESMAAIVSTGGTWPVDRTRCEQGNVVILSAEDDPEDTIKPRLEAAGADLLRVCILDGVVRHADGSGRAISLQQDLYRLSTTLSEIGDVALVVIDPISAYLGACDSHKNADVRALLAPLSDLAAKHRAAVLCISHLNKNGGGEAMLRVTGSLAFIAAARAAFLVTVDKDNEARRLFLPIKNNIGSDRSGLAFELNTAQVNSPAGMIETSQVVWLAEPVTVTADEVIGSQADTDQRSALEDAKEFLLTELKSAPLSVKRILCKANDAGHAEVTIKRAKKALGIQAIKDGMNGGWQWKLPPKGIKNTEEDQSKTMIPFDKNDSLRETTVVDDECEFEV